MIDLGPRGSCDDFDAYAPSVLADEEGVTKGRAMFDRTGRKVWGRVAAFQSAAQHCLQATGATDRKFQLSFSGEGSGETPPRLKLTVGRFVGAKS